MNFVTTVFISMAKKYQYHTCTALYSGRRAYVLMIDILNEDFAMRSNTVQNVCILLTSFKNIPYSFLRALDSAFLYCGIQPTFAKWHASNRSPVQNTSEEQLSRLLFW